MLMQVREVARIPIGRPLVRG